MVQRDDLGAVVTDRLWRRFGTSRQLETARRLAGQLDPYGRAVEKLQGDIVQSGDVATLQFQLDFADAPPPFAAAFPALNR